MSEIVERTALIIKEMINHRMHSIKAEDNLNYLRAYEPIALAVIEAMREPTPAIIAASWCEGWSKDVWKGLIDAALREKIDA